MDCRINEQEGIFEVFFKDKWVSLTMDVWLQVKTKISPEGLLLLCTKCNRNSEYHVQFWIEMRRRWELEKHTFRMAVLWNYFLNADRPLSDWALEEYVERSAIMKGVPNK